MDPRKFIIKFAPILGVLLILLLLPAFLGEYLLFMITMTFIYIIMGSCMRVSLNSGQLNFGVPAFMAIGAYSSALLTKELGIPFIVAFLAAGVFSAIAGLLIGYPSLRLHGVYFLLLTWGFVEVVKATAIRWTSLTGGAIGLLGIPPISLGGIQFTGALNYYFVLVATAIILYILYRLENSRLGLTLKSIGQEERLAEAVGINTYKYKNISFLISCFFAGLAGSLYAHSVGVMSPNVLSFMLIVSIPIYNFLGGLGHFIGPIVGASLLNLITTSLRGLAYYEMIVYAVLIIIVVLFLPEGVIGLPGKIKSAIGHFRQNSFRQK